MKCVTCGAKTLPGKTTDVTDLETCLVVVRNVPCNKCTECNEIIYTGDVIKSLEGVVASVKQSMNEMAVVDYRAIA